MRVLITGGLGFIGSNLACRFMREKAEVVLLDNLGRGGARENITWLRSCGAFTLVKSDIRNARAVNQFFIKHGKFDAVIHQAAQVAVTTSIRDPRSDFEINAAGTFNLLEAVRRYSGNSIFIYASTNKVYGKMENLKIHCNKKRYFYANCSQGINEARPLDFYSPYGCSKGTADQYVRDYSRIYGIRSVVFRQSCIYGTRQFGVEDQGWVAWFIIAAILGRPITIYGDGKQVRDLLYIDDLVDLYLLAIKKISTSSGKIYNVGGGVKNTLSLLELIEMLNQKTGRRIPVVFSKWRQGDQPIYISDISKVKQELGWTPKINVNKGVAKLHHWASNNIPSIKRALAICRP